jgi:hypothetical protein
MTTNWLYLDRTEHPPPRRHRRRTAWLAAVVVGVVGVVLVQATPASAWTVHHPGRHTIVLESKRMSSKTIRGTMHVALHSDGSYEWWADIRNTGRVNKGYKIGCSITFRSIWVTLNFDSGQRDIDRKRTVTIHGDTLGKRHAAVQDHWDDLKRGFDARCYLKGTSIF